MSKKTAAALVILISCFVGLLYYGSNGDQNGTDSDSVVIPVRTPVNIENVRVEKFGKEVANRSVRNSDHSVARPIGQVPPSELRKEARCFLANCEAARSKTIAEMRSGPSTVYLLAVDPPSPEELISVRRKLSELSQSARAWKQNGAQGARNYEEFDQWVGEQIKKYGSFAQSEKKAIVITIHDDSKMPMVGFTYTTQDYAAEVARFTNGTTEFEFENMVSYGRDDGEVLERFRALIVRD
jgi:hypothetical protein